MCKEPLSPIKLLLFFYSGCGKKFQGFNNIFLISVLHSYDYLRIANSNNNNTVGTYCGNQTGKSVRVVGAVAVLIFHTDGSVQRSGFEISFSFFPISLGEFSDVSTAFIALMYLYLASLPRE